MLNAELQFWDPALMQLSTFFPPGQLLPPPRASIRNRYGYSTINTLMGFAVAVAVWEQQLASFSPFGNHDAPCGCSRQCSPSQVTTQNIDYFNIQKGPFLQKYIELMSLSSLFFFNKKKKGHCYGWAVSFGKTNLLLRTAVHYFILVLSED